MLRRKGVTASVICVDWNVIRSHLFKENFSTLNRSQTSNHYQVLGIGQQASQEEIKKAFFTLSKKYHPDMLGSNSVEYSTQKFLQIREAYDTLRDEKKRQNYDRKLTENWTIRAAANPHLNKNRPENDYFAASGQNANIRYRNETSWQRNRRRQEEEQIKQETHTHWWTDYQKRLDEMWERESRGWRWRKNKRTLSALFYALAIMGIYYLLNRMLRID